MISYFTSIERLYKKTEQEEKAASISKNLSEIVMLALERTVSIRGTHVHRYRFSDNDLDRLKGLEIVTTEQNDDVINRYFELVYREVRDKWSRQIKENNGSTRKLLSTYFGEVYEVVFAESGEFRYPKKGGHK